MRIHEIILSLAAGVTLLAGSVVAQPSPLTTQSRLATAADTR